MCNSRLLFALVIGFSIPIPLIADEIFEKRILPS